MDELYDWQKEFKLKQDLVELDVENIERELIKFPRYTLKQAGAAASLKAAIEAGWVEAPECEVGEYEGEKRYFYDGKNIDEMHPGAVRWLGERVDELYREVTQIPKNL